MGKPYLEAAAMLLRTLGGPVCADLIVWLHENRKDHEGIEVYHWTTDFWYVVVKDQTATEKYPGNILLGLTVDIRKDQIFWANDRTYASYANGGNCFCRSHRWFRKLYKKYPTAKSDRNLKWHGTVHDYRERKVHSLVGSGS